MMVTMVLMIMTEVVAMLRRRKRKSKIKSMCMMVTIQKKMVSTYLVHNGDMAQHGRHLRH